MRLLTQYHDIHELQKNPSFWLYYRIIESIVQVLMKVNISRATIQYADFQETFVERSKCLIPIMLLIF